MSGKDCKDGDCISLCDHHFKMTIFIRGIQQLDIEESKYEICQMRWDNKKEGVNRKN